MKLSGFKYLLMVASAAALALFAMPVLAAESGLGPQLRELVTAYANAPHATVAHRAKQTRDLRVNPRTPHVNASGKVQVYIHYRRGAPMTEPSLLEKIGANNVRVSRPLGVIQAWVPIARLRDVATMQGETLVTIPSYGITTDGDAIRPHSDNCLTVVSGLAIDNEAIGAEKVYALHQRGITGQGVKIGIISNGVDCHVESQAAGYLPPNIHIPANYAGEGDEGTAMLEEVHAMAPDAKLAFCSGVTTVDFLQCYQDLESWGADIISDDYRFYDALIYNDTDGVNFLSAIRQFASVHPGISLTTCDYNDRPDYIEGAYQGIKQPEDISLNPTGFKPPVLGVTGRSYRSAMNFGELGGSAPDDIEKVVVSAGGYLYANLTWNDPAVGPYDDFDLFLLDSEFHIVQASTFNQMDDSFGHVPLERIYIENNTGEDETFYLAALCYRCSHPVFIKLYGNSDGSSSFRYLTGGGIGGHAALDEVIAAQGAQAPPSPTSEVPARIYYYGDIGPYCSGDWQAGVSCIQKPDLTAMTGVTISGAGGFGFVKQNGEPGAFFWGTSAASPNVGSVLALLRGAFPNGRSNAQGWEQLLKTAANSGGVTDHDPHHTGAGLVDAMRALASLNGDGLPVASDDSIETHTAESAISALPATDPDGDPLVFSVVETPAHGTVILTDAASGDYVYISRNGYLGKDSFAFKANDGMADSNTATVDISVTNNAPTARDGTLLTKENTETHGTLEASDADGDPLTFVIVRQAEHGSVKLVDASSGDYSYSPNDGYSGKDIFAFKASDGVAESDTATVDITVNAATSPPSKPTHNDDGGGGGNMSPLGLGLLAFAGMLAGLSKRRGKIRTE